MVLHSVLIHSDKPILHSPAENRWRISSTEQQVNGVSRRSSIRSSRRGPQGSSLTEHIGCRETLRLAKSQGALLELKMIVDY